MIAEFFAYDKRGNASSIRKFIGPIRDTITQTVYFTYDPMNRLQALDWFGTYANGYGANNQLFRYDEQGRMNQILGNDDGFEYSIAKYAYHDFGPLKSVLLGGDKVLNTGTLNEYTYLPQGWLKEIRSTQVATGKRSFQQFLGYESKAYDNSNIPASPQSKFTGQITQQLYKYGSDVNSLKPVRLFNYEYDEMGRMLHSDYYQNSNANPLLTNEEIDFASLSMANVDSLDSRFEYDKNGRILGQRTGGVASGDSARYVYRDSSYQLNKVTGKLSPSNTRDLSKDGNFQYDLRGSLVEDSSKGLITRYGWDKMPTRFEISETGEPTRRLFQFYDAQGMRAASIQTKYVSADTLVKTVFYVMMGGATFHEWFEYYHSTGVLALSDDYLTLFGRGGVKIGQVNPFAHWEFFVKNHLGSTVQTVDDGVESGVEEIGSIFDYYSYGDVRTLQDDGDEVVEKYTGKEYDDLTQLTYFGARFYDSELGVWTTTDPGEQFYDSYGFGNDGVNSIDPDGRRKWYRRVGHSIASQGRAQASIISSSAVQLSKGAGHVVMEVGRTSVAIGEGTYDYASDNPWEAAALLTYVAVTGDVVGAYGIYNGLSVARSKGHDLSDWETYGYAAGGFGVSSLAAGGGFITNYATGSATLSMAVASTISTGGQHLLTGGETDIKTSFGAFDYNWNTGDWGRLGENGNSTLENLGYLSGALGNAGDIIKITAPLLPENSKIVGQMENLLGTTFCGGNNPTEGAKGELATVMARFFEEEAPCIDHDNGYDELGLKGPGDLFSNIKGIRLDEAFVKAQLAIFLQTGNVRALVIGTGFGLLAGTKYRSVYGIGY